MSPDLKDVLIATIPSILPGVLVGIGILLNKYDISALRADVKVDIAGSTAGSTESMRE